MRKIPLSSSQAEAVRILAQELLAESNERGDQDHGTVAWAVGYLLRRGSGPALSIGAPDPKPCPVRECPYTAQACPGHDVLPARRGHAPGCLYDERGTPDHTGHCVSLGPTEQPPADHGDGSGAGGRSGGEGA